MISTTTYIIAFAGGIFPALLWLWFWLKEDRKHPEPRGYIILAFSLGMIAVLLVLPFERLVDVYLAGSAVIIVWAFIEEFFKFGVVRAVILGRSVVDEPIDPMIYLITAALGFAALENTLFLLSPLLDGSLTSTILTGNLRFIGATLLHVLSSATIGIALALSFYKSKYARAWYLAFGLILATVLHGVFNLLIINSNGENTFLVFLGVWIGIIILLLLFERIKRIHKPRFSATKGLK